MKRIFLLVIALVLSFKFAYAASSPTFTPTSTWTPIVTSNAGEGTANIVPISAITLSTNTYKIVFVNGPAAFATGSTLSIKAPTGCNALTWGLNGTSNSAGSVSVSASNGVISGVSVSTTLITLTFSSLNAGATVNVWIKNISFFKSNNYPFLVYNDPNHSGNPYYISNSPILSIYGGTATLTITPTFSVTLTPTQFSLQASETNCVANAVGSATAVMTQAQETGTAVMATVIVKMTQTVTFNPTQTAQAIQSNVAATSTVGYAAYATNVSGCNSTPTFVASETQGIINQTATQVAAAFTVTPTYTATPFPQAIVDGYSETAISLILGTSKCITITGATYLDNITFGQADPNTIYVYISGTAIDSLTAYINKRFYGIVVPKGESVYIYSSVSTSPYSEGTIYIRTP